MAIPTQPTETTIVQKAYRLYGKTQTTAEETNAKSDGLAMVKSDLMNRGKEWSFLRTTSYNALTIGVSRIQAPTDYHKLISAVLFDGTRYDTAQAGGAATITLASTDSGTQDSTRGKFIAIKSGTGSGQALQVKSYDSSTKIATMEESWATQPDNTSEYLVVDKQIDLELEQIWNYDELEQPHLSNTPTKIYHQADNAEGDFYFDYAPDKEYVVQLRYYTDFRKMDTDTSTNPRYARILRLLEQLFIQGVFVWLLQDDGRIQIELPKYGQMLSLTEGQYLYPNNTRQHVELAEDVY